MAERIEADLQESKINCYFSNTRNIFWDKIKTKNLPFGFPIPPLLMSGPPIFLSHMSDSSLRVEIIHKLFLSPRPSLFLVWSDIIDIVLLTEQSVVAVVSVCLTESLCFE